MGPSLDIPPMIPPVLFDAQLKHSALVAAHDRLDGSLRLLEERRDQLAEFHGLPASQVSCPFRASSSAAVRSGRVLALCQIG